MNQQIESINAIKSLIDTNKQQIKLLEAELKKLELSLPTLTVQFSEKVSFNFVTNYAKHYPDNKINLDIYQSKCRNDLLRVLFDNNTDSDVYNFIYAGDKPSMKQGYELMRMLKEIYDIANSTEEKERIELVYNKILAKNMYFANFMNCGDNLTEDILNDFLEFIKIIKDCTITTLDINSETIVLTYLVKNKLAYTEVYNKIREVFNQQAYKKLMYLYSIKE